MQTYISSLTLTQQPGGDLAVLNQKTVLWTKRYTVQTQWNLSVKEALNKGHLSNEETVCSPKNIELRKIYLRISDTISIQDSQLGPNCACSL